MSPALQADFLAEQPGKLLLVASSSEILPIVVDCS